MNNKNCFVKPKPKWQRSPLLMNRPKKKKTERPIQSTGNIYRPRTHNKRMGTLTIEIKVEKRLANKMAKQNKWAKEKKMPVCRNTI